MLTTLFQNTNQNLKYFFFINYEKVQMLSICKTLLFLIMLLVLYPFCYSFSLEKGIAEFVFGFAYLMIHVHFLTTNNVRNYLNI